MRCFTVSQDRAIREEVELPSGSSRYVSLNLEYREEEEKFHAQHHKSLDSPKH
jgi:hypothetical protein